MENILFVIFLLKNDVICTEIIIFATEIRKHMMNKQPKLLDVARMRDIFMDNLSQVCKSVFFSNELTMIHGDSQVIRLIMQQQPPFVINDHRLGIITCGEGHVNFNLVGRQLFAGTLVYLGPGTIINPICFSEDFELIGIGLFADFPMPFPLVHSPLLLMARCETSKCLPA